MALLVGLVSETQPTPAQIAFSIRSTLAFVGSSFETTLLVYFSKSFSQLSWSLGHGLFVRQACTAFMPFGLFANHSASFQAIQPGF